MTTQCVVYVAWIEQAFCCSRSSLHVIQKFIERSAMNRRHFGLSVVAAALLAQQLREAVAQSASQSPSSAETDSAWRMRDAATAFLQSLDEAARKTVSFPLEADQRTSWSNLPVAIVPRVGINVGTICSVPLQAVRAITRSQRSCAMMTFCGPRNSNTCNIILQGRGLDAMPSRAWGRQTIGLPSSVSQCQASRGLGCLRAIISARRLLLPAAE